MSDTKDPLRVNFIEVKSALGWDEYFMLQAMLASYRSKDPNTKVGCVFVDQQNHQVTMGYNGAVAGIDESQIPWGNDRSVPLEYQKYGYIIHAESNALSHATRSLAGTRLYVTHFPCNECAKLIATQRVAEVIYLSDKHVGLPENTISKRVFDLAKIPVRKLVLSDSLIERFSLYLSGLISESREN